MTLATRLLFVMSADIWRYMCQPPTLLTMGMRWLLPAATGEGHFLESSRGFVTFPVLLSWWKGLREGFEAAPVGRGVRRAER